MYATNYIKRPSDVIDAQFDLRDFVAAVGLQGVAPEDITFTVRNETGITVTSNMTTIGLLDLRVSGGTIGRVYVIGVEATTVDGDSRVEVSRVRVRDPSLFYLLPDTSVVDDGSTYVLDTYVDADYFEATP